MLHFLASRHLWVFNVENFLGLRGDNVCHLCIIKNEWTGTSGRLHVLVGLLVGSRIRRCREASSETLPDCLGCYMIKDDTLSKTTGPELQKWRFGSDGLPSLQTDEKIWFHLQGSLNGKSNNLKNFPYILPETNIAFDKMAGPKRKPNRLNQASIFRVNLLLVSGRVGNFLQILENFTFENHLPGDSKCPFDHRSLEVTYSPLKGSRELTIPKRSPAELPGRNPRIMCIVWVFIMTHDL